MKRTKTLYLLAGLALVVACITSGWAFQRFHVPSYTPAVMTEFSKQMRTHCLGRFLIDVPADLGVPSVSYANFYFGLGSDFKQVEVQMPHTEDMSQEDFDRLVATRRGELQNGRNAYIDAPMLLAERSIYTPTGDAVLFRRLYRDQGSVSTIVSELHALVGGRYVILLSESFPPSDLGNEVARTLYKLADPIVAENHLDMVARHMRRAADAEHAGPGFCLNGVLFNQRDSGVDEEKASFDFNDTTTRQPKLSISMRGKFGYDKETLHQRVSRVLAFMSGLEDEGPIRKVRKGERTIAGMPFQEWAQEIYTNKYKTTQYSFFVQNLKPEPEDKRFERPGTSITLVSGADDYQSSSPYSLPQLEQAWDLWLSTFRLSPGNGGPHP